MKKRYLILIMLISVIALTSCLDTLKQYCFHIYSESYESDSKSHWKVCNICKAKDVENHKFDDGEIEEEPTYTSDGVRRYTCYICDYYYDEPIEKLEQDDTHTHSFSNLWECDDEYHWHDSICGCDITSNKEKHDGTATCTEYAKCSVCGIKHGNMLDHKFTDYVNNNDGTETAYCDYGCGTTDSRDVTAEEHVHVFDQMIESWDTWAAGGDCQTGTTFFKSCVCGEKGTETFNDGKPQPHHFISYHYNNDATEFEDGTETAYCEYGCGETDTRVIVGSALGHVHVFDQEYMTDKTFVMGPTCEHGTIFYKTCKCGEIGTETFDDEKPNSHKYTNYVYNNDATETKDGTETAYCEYGCGETDTRIKEGSKLEHQHLFVIKDNGDPYIAKSPTCQNGWLFYYICPCGEIGTETWETGEKENHKFFDYVYDNNATIEADGTETAYCYYGCGTTDTRVKEGTCLGHQHVFDVKNTGDYYIAESRNCIHGTLYYYSCECGEKGTETFEIGDVEPHKFFDYVYDNNATEAEDGTETAYCYYGCGTTDTRVKEGTALGHVHVYNVKNNGDYYYVDSPTCQHGYIYYYSCECGERGTETWDDGNIGNHNYKTSYFWLENNTKVSATAFCLNGCGSVVSEEVGTTYSVEIEPTSTSDGVGCYTTLPFDNDCFWVQTKRVVITYASVDVTGNSVYGYNDLINFNNGEAMQDLYENLYNASMEFSTSTKDVSTSFDGLYVIEVADFGSLYLTAEEALSVWMIFYIENPGFYWLANTVWTSGNNLLLSIDEVYANYSYREQCDKAVYDMVQDCKDYLKNADNEIEKAKLVHDFIVNRIDYAYEADGVTAQDDIWAHNIIGAAMYEYGVCETYAKTYLYLCLLNGVDCIIVTGYAGGPHAWNYICINDKWYAVDCTWDDQPYGVIYNFFGVSKQDFSDHTPDKPYYNNDTFLYNLPELNDTGLFN